MIVKFNKKTLRFSLIFGLIWSVIGIISIIFDSSNFFYYVYVIIGLLYLITYAFQKHYQYLTLTDSSITKHGLPSKTLLFSEINRIKYIARTYTLFTGTKQITINKDLIESSSLEELESIIESLKP